MILETREIGFHQQGLLKTEAFQRKAYIGCLKGHRKSKVSDAVEMA